MCWQFNTVFHDAVLDLQFFMSQHDLKVYWFDNWVITATHNNRRASFFTLSYIIKIQKVFLIRCFKLRNLERRWLTTFYELEEILQHFKLRYFNTKIRFRETIKLVYILIFVHYILLAAFATPYTVCVRVFACTTITALFQ